MGDSKKNFVCVGNWRAKDPGQNGFGIYRYGEADGSLTYVKTVLSDIYVGATYIDPRTNILYCTDEQPNLPGQVGGGGQVIAVKLDPQSGDMTEINRLPSYGAMPSYVAATPCSKYIVVCHHANETPITKTVKDVFGKYHIVTEYDETSTVLFPLREDGSIGEPCDMYKHTGSGLLHVQTNPHVHSVVMSPSGELFAECDKGTDRILFFRIDREKGKLILCNDYKSVPGSSPRYSCFHPTLPFWYMNNETMQIVRGFRYKETGELEHICTIDALPDGYEDDPTKGKYERPWQSDIRIHPSGKYIYTLFRNINAVSVLAVDQASGALAKIQSVDIEGDGPRGCAISPDGRFMLIAALNSGEVLTWAIGEDGRISPTGMKAKEPSPGNVTFF